MVCTFGVKSMILESGLGFKCQRGHFQLAVLKWVTELLNLKEQVVGISDIKYIVPLATT